MFFSPYLGVLSPILRDEYLTSAVRTKEGNKAGSNQPPARDLSPSLVLTAEVKYSSRKIGLKTPRYGEKNMTHDSVNIFFKLLLKNLL